MGGYGFSGGQIKPLKAAVIVLGILLSLDQGHGNAAVMIQHLHVSALKFITSLPSKVQYSGTSESRRAAAPENTEESGFVTL